MTEGIRELGDVLFSVEHLTCTFGEKKALDDVSLTIRGNRITAICGLSGSGKSTFLSILGLTRPRQHTGRVTLSLPASTDHRGLLANYEVLSEVKETSLRNQKFGFVLQSSYLMPTLSARENVELPLLLQKNSSDERQTVYSRLLTSVTTLSELENDLASEDHKLPENLSGGQRQRFGILRGLIHDPVVVFADEPCANLDPANRELVMELLLAWKDGKLNSKADRNQRTLILVSHDADSIVRYADDIAVLHRGKLVGNRILDRKRDLPADDYTASKMLIRWITGSDEPRFDAALVSRQVTPESLSTEVSARAKPDSGKCRPLPIAAAYRIAKSGLVCNSHYRWITLFIVMTISLVFAAWFLTTGLLNGGELVSEHRLKSRPLARRLLLGDENTELQPEYIQSLAHRLSSAVQVDAVSPFRVLDWQFFVPENEAYTTGIKGRTINMTQSGGLQRNILARMTDPATNFAPSASPDRKAPGSLELSPLSPAEPDDLHPLLKGLGLAVDRRKSFTGKDAGQGIILCPRMMHRMYGNVPVSERTVPKTVLMDLQDQNLKRNGLMELPVLGVTVHDPPEVVYFICSEDYARQLAGDVVIRTARLGPLVDTENQSSTSDSALSSADWDAAVQETLQYLEERDGLLVQDRTPAAIVDLQHNCLELTMTENEWGRDDWAVFRDALRNAVKKSDWCLASIEDATDRPRTLLSARGTACDLCYQMVGVYLDDVYSMPAAVQAVKDDEKLKGRVDRVVAELVNQLRSFSESKAIVLSSVKWILAIICFVCLLIIQILRAARKRPEAAMLRVIGYSRTDLLKLVVCDTAILWILGVMVGLLIGTCAGWGTASWNYADSIEQRLAFPFQWSEAASVAILCLHIVLGSGSIAAVTWMKGAPADLFQ